MVRSQTLYPAELRARRNGAVSPHRVRHTARDFNNLPGFRTAKQIQTLPSHSIHFGIATRLYLGAAITLAPLDGLLLLTISCFALLAQEDVSNADLRG